MSSTPRSAFPGGAAPLPISLQSVMNRMHVVSVPYALMKVNPLSWIQKVCAYKGEGGILLSRLAGQSEAILGD